MKSKNRKNILAANGLLMLTAMVAVITAGTGTAMAKSLYVIADLIGSTSDATAPVHAYDIGVDGTLTFQAEHAIRHRMLGPVGMAIDSDSGYLFITYEVSGDIRLVDGTTMTDVGEIPAPDATDLAGIVYDHSKGLLYCVDRARSNLYVYNWDPQAITLTHVEGSPFTLHRATAYGIALDEIDGLLYVGNGKNTVTVYNTDDWSLVNEIELSRVAISVAVDVMNGYLYTGGGYAGNFYLTQYNLVKGLENSVQVEPDAGVMGLAVDPDTSLVYMSTGKNNAPGGDNLLVYDRNLNEVGRTHIGGNPTGLAIPGKDIGFNPFNLTKVLLSGAVGDSGDKDTPIVGTGKEITYGIGFSNLRNEFTVTGVSVVDVLPRSVTFVAADDDGVGGRYDSKTHTYRWTYQDLPPGASATLKLTVRVNSDVEAGSIISNSVTINSNETAPATTRLDVLARNNSLNLTKIIRGVAAGRVIAVEPDEVITYDICFDNFDNNFTATDILLIDTLPPDVDFISAKNGKGTGFYDSKSHAYTWWHPDMPTGSSDCVELVVRVHPNLAPGTIITNDTIIDSNETPASMASATAVTSFAGLQISKAIVGATEGKLTLVGEGETIEYIICFENKNTETATDVAVVDSLPKEVSFVKADGDGTFGHYDPKTHTYTWMYPSLEPKAKSPTCVTLTVRVNKDVPPATILTNKVTISSNEAPATAVTNDDAATYFNPLDLKKVVIGGFGGEIEWADIDDEVIYGIEYKNTNDFAVNNVIITDKLPKEVSFVAADDDGVFGSYDPDSHTYQWVYPSLGAGESAVVKLVVHVNANVKPYTTITNSVSIDSDETVETPDGTSIDVITAEPPIPVQSLTIIPDMIRQTGANEEIQAVLILPQGVGRDQLNEVVLPVLKRPGALRNVKAKRHVVFGTATTSKVIAIFDKNEILDAVDQRGQVTLKVKGKFNSGRSFIGEATVHITRFTG